MTAISLRNQAADRRSVKIELARIRTSKYQPRREFDEKSIASLAESIHRFGLLSPLLVRRIAAGYELIAGERRLRAMLALGWRECDAIVLGARDCDCALIGLIENLQREELHYLDEALACRAILREHALTQEALAAAIGKSPSALANLLRLLRLDARVCERLRQCDLSERHARALLSLKDADKQLEMVEIAFKERLSVRQLEERIQRMIQAKPVSKLPEKLLKENRLVVNALNETVRQLRRIGVSASSRVETRKDSFDVIVTVKLGG